jgi:hypothetical protein
MASTTVAPFAQTILSVPSGSKLATFSTLPYKVDNLTTFANEPSAMINAFNGSGANTTTAYGSATSVTVTAGASPVYCNIGVSPVAYERANGQPTPGTLNATGTLTATLILGGIVTSSTAAAVTATLDTGTVMDAAFTAAADDSFDWTAINTGGANAFTVAASTGHTIVGSGAVAASTSGRFRTRKTAANTFVTYRLA